MKYDTMIIVEALETTVELSPEEYEWLADAIEVVKNAEDIEDLYGVFEPLECNLSALLAHVTDDQAAMVMEYLHRGYMSVDLFDDDVANFRPSKNSVLTYGQDKPYQIYFCYGNQRGKNTTSISTTASDPSYKGADYELTDDEVIKLLSITRAEHLKMRDLARAQAQNRA